MYEKIEGKSLKAYLLGCRDTEKEFMKILKTIVNNHKDESLIKEIKKLFE